MSTDSSSARSPRRCTATATASTRSTCSRWSPASACTRTGARIGGLKEDFPEGFYERVPAILEYYRTRVEQWLEFLIDNDVFIERTRGIGELPADVALEYGVSGPNLRASGVPFDVRKIEDYLGYGDYEFEVPVGERGDCFDRYIQRVREMWESCNIVEQALDDLPPGPINTGVGRTFKVPAGEVYIRAEGPRGEHGYHLISNGGREPYRLKIRTASFSNVSVLPYLLKDTYVPGHRRDPRQPRLRRRGHRPMNAADPACRSSVPSIVLVGGLLGVRRRCSTGCSRSTRGSCTGIGPMYAGRFHGIGQPIAEVIKPIQKEDIVPAAADAPVFRLAPFVALLAVVPRSSR